MGKTNPINAPKRRSRSAVIDAMLQAFSEEHAEERDRLAAEYFAHYPDATPEERVQIQILVQSEFLTRCLWAIENRIWNEEIDRAEIPDLALGEAWIKRSADFMRIQSRETAADKAFHKALHELERLRAARTAKSPGGGPRSKRHKLVEMPTIGSRIN